MIENAEWSPLGGFHLSQSVCRFVLFDRLSITPSIQIDPSKTQMGLGPARVDRHGGPVGFHRLILFPQLCHAISDPFMKEWVLWFQLKGLTVIFHRTFRIARQTVKVSCLMKHSDIVRCSFKQLLGNSQCLSIIP